MKSTECLNSVLPECGVGMSFGVDVLWNAYITDTHPPSLHSVTPLRPEVHYKLTKLGRKEKRQNSTLGQG